ncbi:hypothetical protein CLU79DRAFT_741460 [Phycomyces nitens]|nr:hypothetical protein CLU79DRAFT_741460 [Phycomyces nitens]
MSTENDINTLAQTLSASYSALMQYRSLGQDEILNHLSQLAKHSQHLPLPWFTPSFISVCFSLREQFFSQPVPEWKGLESIYSLWSIWVRRLSGAPAAIPAVETDLVRVLESIHSLLTLQKGAPSSLQKEAWIGLVGLVGRAPLVYNDVRILNDMTDVIKHQDSNTHMAESIEAGVAHALAETTALNAFEIESCERLVEAYIQLISRLPDHRLRPVINVFEHSIDKRSKEKPVTKAVADLGNLVALTKTAVEAREESLEVKMTRLAVLVGVVRMLQFNQGAKTSKVVGFQKQMEALFVDVFDKVVAEAVSKDQVYSFEKHQDVIALFAGQCLPTLSVKAIQGMNLEAVLRCIESFLITSKFAWEDGKIIDNLSNESKDTEAINTILQDPLHKDIGRISRAAAKVIEAILTVGDPLSIGSVESLLDRLTGFSYRIFIAWDRFVVRYGMDAMDKELSTAVWSFFKTLLFATTVIFKAVAVDYPNGEGLVLVPGAAQNSIYLYANLHFITEHLGTSTGFQAYQDTLTNTVSYLTHKDNVCKLNHVLKNGYKEYVPCQYTIDTTPPVQVLSTVHISRLLFYTNLIEQVMPYIEDPVLEDMILPIIYPVLKWDPIRSKDLYESVHAAILSLLAAKKPVAREVAGVYANILIKSFPRQINLQQFTFGYSSMIQSLCEMDDAIAWLTVGYLLKKVDELTDESQSVERSQYITILIEIMKPLSLGPFYAVYLNKLKTLVLNQETPGMKKATLKLLFETVSGTGISDMRRVETVGWFLDLKNQVGI